MAKDEPHNFNDAATRPEILTTTGPDSPLSWSKFRYYARPIRRYLAAIGAPPGSLDDLSQEALLLLHTRVLPSYNPSRGPFRPYFKRALRNLLNDHLRSRGHDPIPLAEIDIADESGPGEDPSPIDPEALLKERLAELFDRYVREAVPLEEQAAAEILGARLAGRSQREIATERGVTERWVRSLQERAAARFWPWARSTFHPDDWARLVPADLASARPREITRWLSRRKREQLVATLIRLFAARDESADAAARTAAGSPPPPVDPASTRSEPDRPTAE